MGEGELLLVVGQRVCSWVGAVVVYVQIYGGLAVVEPVGKCWLLLQVGTMLHGTTTRTNFFLIHINFIVLMLAICLR